MTFEQIVNEVMQRMSLTSADAVTRVGLAVNRHYRRITSLLGMETTRVSTVNGMLTLGGSVVTFTGIEKIDRIFDTTDPTNNRLLIEVSLHRQRVTNKGAAAPSTWAMEEAGPNYVRVLFDTTAQQDYSLQADGWITRVDLFGPDEPLFPASFHDVLTWFVLSEELLRKEKGQLAASYEAKAEKLLSDLRFQLADTHTRTFRQNDPGTQGRTTGGAAGGGAPQGGSSYTQTGDITFDRPGTGVPPFFVAPDNDGVVTNLNADMVDNEHAAELHDLGNATGSLPMAQMPAIPPNTVIGRSSELIGIGAPQALQVWTGLATEAGRLLIPNEGIVTPLIAPLAVTTPKIADAAVTTPKIADGNVTAVKIPDNELPAAKLKASASPIVFARYAAGPGPGQEATLAPSITLAGGVIKVVPAGAASELQFNDAGTLGGATGLTWDKTNGALNYPTQPRCMLTSQGPYSPVASTWGTVPFPAEEYDVGNLHSTVSNTTRITIPAGFGGFWLLGAGTSWINANTGPSRLRLKKNGTTVIATAGPGPTTTSAQTSHGIVIAPAVLVPGDYVEFEIWQGNTAAHPASGSNREDLIQFWAVRLVG